MEKTTTVALTEQEIRTILVGLHSYRYDLSKEVQESEARTGNPAEFARLEYEEVSAIIRKIRDAK